jgi:hypothetical protein
MPYKRDNFNQQANRFKGFLQFFIGVAYLISGGFIIQKGWFFVQLEPYVSLSLGIVLILYGLFRMYRSYNIFKEKNESS